jgi:hypothetical protein
MASRSSRISTTVANTIVATSGQGDLEGNGRQSSDHGPVISGPHEQPFICETEKFTLMSGGTLGKPLDANCSVVTRVDYVYKSTNPAAPAGRWPRRRHGLQATRDPKNLPADVAMTTTSLGKQVPFVVRVETGTINRGVYEIAVLADGWNQRLTYTFGGGCAGGWFKQGTGTGGVDDESHARTGVRRGVELAQRDGERLRRADDH